jgi:hypothetical protein
MAVPSRSVVGTLGACVVLVGPAAAQGTYHGPSEWREYAGEIAARQGFTRCEPCNLDGDGAPDQATLQDGVVFVTLSPEFFGAVASDVAPARDFTVLPGIPGRSLDRLLLAGQDGVVVTTLPKREEPFVFLPVVAATDVSRIRIADWDGDLVPELFLLRDGSIEIHDIAEPERAWLRAAIPVPELADDFVVLRFDPMRPEAQVAVSHKGGATVLAAGAERPVWSILDDAEASLLATTRAIDGREGLVRVAQRRLLEEPLPRQWFTVHWSDQDEPTLDFGYAQVAAMVPTDIEGDGDLDLMLSVKWSYDAFLLVNRSEEGELNGDRSLTAGLLEFVILPLGLPGPARDNQSMPTLSDLDGDGDLDLFMNLEAADGYLTVKSPLAGDESELAVLPMPSAFCELEDSTWQFELALKSPQRRIDGCDHLEIVAWRQPLLELPIEGEREVAMIVPMPDFDAAGIATIVIPFAEGGWMPGAWRFLVRPVALDSGAIVRGLSATTFAFVTDEEARDALVAESETRSFIAVDIIDLSSKKGGARTVAAGGTLGGGMVSFPSLMWFLSNRP